ncbi:MAG: helix-hairpin-helix domain-containing protein [Solitalea-like symbiont of Acarus siro]
MLKKLLNIINFSKSQTKGILILTALLFISYVFRMIIPFLYTDNNPKKDKKFLAYKEAAIAFNKKLDNIAKTNSELNYNHQIYKTKPNNYFKKLHLQDKHINPTNETKLIEINSATKEQLLTIEHIGPTFSSRIVKYRDMLGGFYSKEQFKEVYRITPLALENLYKRTTIDISLIKKININKADNKGIWSIPYLNYSQKKILFLYIQDRGQINNLNELYNIESINKELIDKIIPYISLK